MAPHRDPDIHLLADIFVIFVQRLILRLEEMQNRRMHHDVIGADRLGMFGKIDHHVHVLVGAGHDGLEAVLLRGLDRDLEGALALRHRHREELALLAGDEHAVDAEIVLPMIEIAGESPSRRSCKSCVNGVSAAAHTPFMCFARIGLRVFPAVFHRSRSFPQIPFCMAFQIFSLVSGISRCVTPKAFSASTAAFTIAAGTPTQPASPTPLAPR